MIATADIPSPISGLLDQVADTALFDTPAVAKFKVYGGESKLNSDRAAGRGLDFIRLGGRVYYTGATLKRALADAIAAGRTPRRHQRRAA